MFKLINKITERLELRSIESILTLFIGSCILVLSGLAGFILWYSSASTLVVCTVLVLLICPFALLCWYVRRALLNPYYRFSAVLEAIRNEDYSLRANPKFNQGAVKLLADEITTMTAELQNRKSQYDQQAVLVLRLIEQLATPIVVLNKEHKLHHANEAFSNWRKQPWQTLRHTNADDLGFMLSANKWQLSDESLIAKWQLRHSQFTMQEQSYELLVLTNIEQVVYHTEQLAWQKMTRVLSHEINNSLSPIKSLAQTLQDMLKGNDDFAKLDPALQVIVERSDGLMQFVNRYANLSKQFDVHIVQCELAPLFQSVGNLFDYPIKIKCDTLFVFADKVLLEQVLVNLVKNAIEASKSQQLIELNAYEQGKQIVIEVKDSGSGIQNTDNLFVPFYTTKAQGKGIGLNLCRNMIEQQGAKLTLSNREDKTGAIAQCWFDI
ncbi:sensor histidine kinase [Pseudoalteromonas sp. MTN2-4]|uniref:sensor histidine kinase n=1 Tax=Pseudoalteromonas sp. MTN2-4 TaxID=3056555 RepID=UPI0036F1C39B